MQDLHEISLKSLEVYAKILVDGFLTGKHKSPYHGFSVEFAEHKIYNKGQSTKHIDWKLYARTNKLFVKRFEEETNLRCQIVIDASSSMRYPLKKKYSFNQPNKLLFSILASASLMKLFVKQRDAVGLSLFSEGVDYHSASKTTLKHLISLKKVMLEDFNKTENAKKTFSVKSLHQIASQLNKRSLVMIFTDMLDTENSLDEIFLALQHLKFNKHEVILFHLMDYKSELNFDFDNVPHKFIDIETNESIEVNPLTIKDSYKVKSAKFMKKIKLLCHKNKIDLVKIDINNDLESVLSSYLLKRKKIY